MEGVEREAEGSMTTVEKVQCMCGGGGEEGWKEWRQRQSGKR